MYFLNSCETVGEIKTRGNHDSAYYFKRFSKEEEIETAEILQEEFASYLDSYYAAKENQDNAHILKKKKK